MSTHEQLEYYESAVRSDNVLVGENPGPAEHVAELTGLWEHRAILRQLRLQEGIPICNGNGHCLERPTLLCLNGEHDTCPNHTDSCFLCPPRTH